MGAASTSLTAVVLSAQDYALLINRLEQLEAQVRQLASVNHKPVIDPFLTVEEAARLLKVSTKTVYRRIEKRELKTVLLSGKSYGIRKSEIEKYLTRNGEPRK